MTNLAAEQLVQAGFSFRLMREKDVPQLLEIENTSFISPWTRNMFLRELIVPFSQFWVAERDQEIAGYIGYWLVDDEAHILTVAVKEPFRRKGIAREMFARAFEMLGARHVRQVYLEVRKSNESARALYAVLGFSIIGCRKNYYTAENEDAIVMKKEITPEPRIHNGHIG